MLTLDDLNDAASCTIKGENANVKNRYETFC